jgi:nucleoside-diphosphate-sugar epimerase
LSTKTEVESKYRALLEPSPSLVNDVAKLDGDIMILGAGGKMGPALARLARHAVDLAGVGKRVIAVSRFSEEGLQADLEAGNIETHSIDLLDDKALQGLPPVKNVLYLAGTKFGTSGKESFTWAMNAYLPGRVAEKFRDSRIVVFSTGNVYHLTPVKMGGADENRMPEPVGEYAQSCLGRERVFQYHSAKNNTPILIYRLNYANDVTYGVLLEIALAVKEDKAIDLSMGYVNVIWQGDANEIAIRCLHHCNVPGKILNVTGPETLSVRWVAEQFGKLFGKKPRFENMEAETALLSNASEAGRLFGPPRVTVKQMISLMHEWIAAGGRKLNKPTHFQERKGQF